MGERDAERVDEAMQAFKQASREVTPGDMRGPLKVLSAQDVRRLIEKTLEEAVELRQATSLSRIAALENDLVATRRKCRELEESLAQEAGGNLRADELEAARA